MRTPFKVSGGPLTRYRLKVAVHAWAVRVGSSLAVLLTADQVLTILMSQWEGMRANVFWTLLLACTLWGLAGAWVKARGLSYQQYDLDSGHYIAVRVADFEDSMRQHRQANIALGAHDTFDPTQLLGHSLHQLVFSKYLHPTPGSVAGHELSIRQSLALATPSGEEPASTQAHPYGTVAVLPMLAVGAEAASDDRPARYAYLVANSTRGSHSFVASSHQSRGTTPLRSIHARHRLTKDISPTLLMPLIGAGGSSAVTPMASLVQTIDDYFHDWRRVRTDRGGYDPVPRLVISLRPQELQAGTVDLEVVHGYLRAKLAAARAV